MAQHKAPTAVTIAPTASESALRLWVERYWKVIAIVLVAVAAWIIFQVQHHSAKRKLGKDAWSRLLTVAAPDPNTGALEGAPDDLRRIEGEISGSPAGPWALYMAATGAAEAKEYDKARAILEELQQKYPKHSLVTEPLVPDATGVSLPPARALAARMEAQAKFVQEHPDLFANPELPADAPRVRLTTDKGPIVVGLYSQSAPALAENFIKLVKDGSYVGTKFHITMRNQYIQGGDPTSKEGEPSSWGRGGPGYTLEKSSVPLKHFAGVLSMVPDPTDSSKLSGSQFLITSDEVHSLDESHVVFGKVLEGLDVVRQIESSPLAERSFNQPKVPVVLTGAEVL